MLGAAGIALNTHISFYITSFHIMQHNIGRCINQA